MTPATETISDLARRIFLNSHLVAPLLLLVLALVAPWFFRKKGRTIRFTAFLCLTSLFAIFAFRTASNDLHYFLQQEAFNSEENMKMFTNLSATRTQLRNLSLEDGVSMSDASIIAEIYFHQYVGCGSFMGIKGTSQGHWIVDARFGYGAAPVVGFTIDMETGEINSPIGPNFRNPYLMTRIRR